ncbi:MULTISPECIES: glutamine amidotransferase [unclassified Marinovum]
MSQFLILQLRPETDASDGEYDAIRAKAGLAERQCHRIRLDCEELPQGLDPRDFAGVIVGGGPGCVSDPAEGKDPVEARIERAVLSLMPAITQSDHPFMGCCYGIGILGAHLGADVSKARYGEAVGPTLCEMTEEGARDPLLEGLPQQFEAFVGHKEALQGLPAGCTHLLASAPCPFQMVRHGANVYATQFHPEADGAVFEARIRTYRSHGYFPPETADDLIAMCHAADVRQPEIILRRFVERYG